MRIGRFYRVEYRLIRRCRFVSWTPRHPWEEREEEAAGSMPSGERHARRCGREAEGSRTLWVRPCYIPSLTL